MLRVISACLAIVAVLSLIGCASSLRGSPERLFSKAEELDQIKLNSGATQIVAYHAAAGAQKEQLRNEIILGRLYAIDLQYGEFEAKLTRERQKIPFASTTASIALSGTGTLVAGETTKSILSAVDTALKGVTESYTKDILVGKTIGFLQEAMRANRLRVKTRIFRQLSRSVRSYPLALALLDIETYYRAGTITSGLIGLSAQAAIDLQEAEKLELKTINIALRTTSRASDRLPPVSDFVRAPNALTDFERRQRRGFIMKLQRTLCVIPADGKWGPRTREAVASFYRGADDPREYITTTGIKWADSILLKQAMREHGHCNDPKNPNSHDSASELGARMS